MEYQMGAAEMRFAEILWEAAPLSSGELVRLSAEKLGWKKSTVYTVLRRLCEKGLFRNEGGTVTVLVDRASFEESRSLQSKRLSRVFSNTTVQKHQFFGTQLSSQSNSHIHT